MQEECQYSWNHRRRHAIKPTKPIERNCETCSVDVSDDGDCVDCWEPDYVNWQPRKGK